MTQLVENLKQSTKFEELIGYLQKNTLFIENFTTQYKKIKAIDRDESQQGNIYCYENLLNKQNVVVQRFDFKIESTQIDDFLLKQAFEHFDTLLEANRNLNCQNVTQIEGFHFEKRQTCYYFYIVLENLENNIQNIIADKKISKVQFSFKENLSLARQLLRLSAETQINKLSIKDFIPKNIYFKTNKYGDKIYKIFKFYPTQIQELNLKQTSDPTSKSNLYESIEIQYLKQIGSKINNDVIQFDSEKSYIYSLGISLLSYGLLMENPNRPTDQLTHNPLELINCGLGPDSNQWSQNLQTNIDFIKFMYKTEDKIQQYGNFIKILLSYSPQNRPSPAILEKSFLSVFYGLKCDFTGVSVCTQQIEREEIKLTDDEKKHGPSNIYGTKVLGQGIKLSQIVTDKLQQLGEYQYKKDDIYEKKYENSVELGVYKLRNDSLYIGYWYQGKQQGKGKLIFQDGSIYEGYFENGKIHGEGRMIYQDGEYYIGQWQNGQMEGLGKKVYKDGTEYNGSWKQSQKNGLGREIYKNGSRYEGNYENGVKQNQGSFKWQNGNSYQGEFQNDKINGVGVYIWADKKFYKGQFKDNQMNGKGILKWPDGKVYEGEFLNDQQSGYGIFIWEDKKCYKGYWKNGKYEGQGIFYDKDGNLEKKGMYKDGDLISEIKE